MVVESGHRFCRRKQANERILNDFEAIGSESPTEVSQPPVEDVFRWSICADCCTPAHEFNEEARHRVWLSRRPAGRDRHQRDDLRPGPDSSYQVQVRATNAEGDSDWSLSGTGQTAAAAVMANTPATGAATITGTAQVGQTLTAVTSGIMDADGLTMVSYAYQWIRVATDSTETDISGATASTYTLVAADLGTTIKVKVTFDDDDGNPETLTSAATATVTAAAVMATCAVPSLTGRTQIWTAALTVGSVIAPTETLYGFTNTRGELSDTTFDIGTNGYTIARVTDSNLATNNFRFGLTSALTDAEVADLVVHVCGEYFAFADASYNSSQMTYTWSNSGLDWSGLTMRTLYLSVPANTPATGAPTITGTARVGQTLTAVTSGIMDADGLTSPTYTYQWILVATDSTEADISGATASTYTLVAADLGTTIKVKVTFDDDDMNSETLTSAATAAVAAATAAAEVTSVTITSTPPYVTGNEIEFSVVFNAAVTVAGTPRLRFNINFPMGGGDEDADLESGSSTDTLVFTYTVLATNADHDGVEIKNNGLTLDTGDTITANGTNAVLDYTGGRQPAHRVNSLPTVTTVSVTSSPVSGDTYGTGEMIQFTVTFTRAVTVAGTPEFEFCLGNAGSNCITGTDPPARRRATLSSGSGTTMVVWSYTVVAGDVDMTGIFVGDGPHDQVQRGGVDPGHGRTRRRADPRGAGHPEQPQGQWRDDHQHPRDGRADHHGHGAGGADADGGHHRHHGRRRADPPHIIHPPSGSG